MASSDYPISPILSGVPLNSNVGFNNSWIQVDSPYHPTYAQLTYAVNLDDSLVKLDTIADIITSSIGSYTNLFIALTAAIDGINQTQVFDYNSYFKSLTSSSDVIEANTFVLNGIVNGLTAIQTDKQNQLIQLAQSLTSIQVDKQNQYIGLSQLLTSIQVDKQNQLIQLAQSLTSIQVDKQNQYIGLSQLLTSIQVDKQNQLIALGHSLTSISNRIDSNTDHVEDLITATNDNLSVIMGWDYATSTNQQDLNDIAQSINNVLFDTQNKIIALNQSLTSIQVDKQNQAITLLHQLTANTETLEVNTYGVETILWSLTSIVTDKQNQLIALNQSLTAIQVDKQNQLIALGQSLTSLQNDKQNQLIALGQSLTSLQNDKQNQLIALNHSLTAIQVDKQNQLIALGQSLTSLQNDKQNQLIALGQSLNDSNQKIAGFSIPPHDQIDITYISTTNNIDTITYSNSSVSVLSLVMTYDPHPPTIDDARIKRVKKI
jgi:iron-sulfur cluster repair protein YtfE (RIC family)